MHVSFNDCFTTSRISTLPLCKYIFFLVGFIINMKNFFSFSFISLNLCTFELTDVTADTEPWTFLKVCVHCSTRRSWTACKRRSMHANECVRWRARINMNAYFFLCLFFFICGLQMSPPSFGQNKTPARTHIQSLRQRWCYFILSLSSSHFFLFYFSTNRNTYNCLDWVHVYIITPKWFVFLFDFVISFGSFSFSYNLNRKYHYVKGIIIRAHVMIWQTADARVYLDYVFGQEAEWKGYTIMTTVSRLIITYTYAYFESDVQKVNITHTFSISSIDKSINSSWWISSRAILIRKIISIPCIKKNEMK
jgi:hypothetical protein